MQPNPLFLKQSKAFWASVRSISQGVGYTVRGANQIKVPSLRDMENCFTGLGLDPASLVIRGEPTALGKLLHEYFQYRADVLNNHVQHMLMDAEAAEKLYEELHAKLQPSRAVPMNKQTGEKKKIAYLTAIVNMLVEAYSDGEECDFDPRELTTVTLNNAPLRTLARRVDGAFPSAVNPIAIWEIKEYYYTTTFGSRVADGVYETLLDGMEIEELREHEGIEVKHYLMADAHYTWWQCGRSYLCRIVDMLHMGYVDEVLFGREVVSEMPRIVSDWLAAAKVRKANGSALA